MSKELLHHYEILLLAKTEITEDEQAMMKKEMENLVSSATGTIESFDRWGKYRLCYPVQKNEFGIYMLMRYTAPRGAVSIALNKNINTLLKIKCNDFIMRAAIVKLNGAAPTHYEKPEALDAAGKTTDIDSLIKENNIDGLLSSVDASTPDRATATEVTKNVGQELLASIDDTDPIEA